MLRGRGGGGSALGQRECQVVEERNCRSEPQEGSLSVGVAFLLRMKQEGLNTCTPRRASFANHSHTSRSNNKRVSCLLIWSQGAGLNSLKSSRGPLSFSGRKIEKCEVRRGAKLHPEECLVRKQGSLPPRPSVTTPKDGNATRLIKMMNCVSFSYPSPGSLLNSPYEPFQFLFVSKKIISFSSMDAAGGHRITSTRVSRTGRTPNSEERRLLLL